MIRTRCALYHLMLSVALIVSAPSYGQDTQADPPIAKNIQPEADEALKRMGQLLSETESFRFNAHITQDLTMSAGLKVQMYQERNVTVVRPGKLHVISDGDMDENQAWFNEGRLSVLDPLRGVYAQIDGPKDIDGILDHLALERGWVMPLSDMLVSDPYTSATANVQMGLYLGQHRVRDTVCDHLAFRQEGIDWQIWIDAGETPVPRKMLITFIELAGQPQWAVELDGWDLSPDVEVGQFDFEAPDDADRVEFDEFRSR